MGDAFLVWFCCGVLVGFGFGLRFWVLLGAAAAWLVLAFFVVVAVYVFGACASW